MKMMNFDENGVATPESQSFIQERVNNIINNRWISPAQKAAKLRDLYNQYGLAYGTYERKGTFKVVEPNREVKSQVAQDSELIWVLVICILGLAVCFLGTIDVWFMEHGMNLDIVKHIERFFQWLFGGFG